MTLVEFKDVLFDVLNESDELNVLDIQINDTKTGYRLQTEDGSWFNIKCEGLEG